MKTYFGTQPGYMKRLKAGDLVWVAEAHSTPDVRRVERLTNTQVVLHGESRRFDRVDGYQIGRSFYMRHITGLAKPSDLQKQQAAETASASRFFSACSRAENIERQRINLNQLFPGENVRVSRDMNLDMIPGRTPDKWTVTISNLSGTRVSALARLVEEL